MPKTQTSKSRFKSAYAGRWLAPHQWLAEFCCERKAAKDKKALPVRFWEDAEWLKFFKFQAVIASRLMKKYHPLAIAEALRTTKGCYSLNAPFLLKNIELAQIKYRDRLLEYEQSEYDNEPIIEQRSVIIEPMRPAFIPTGEASLLSKLD